VWQYQNALLQLVRRDLRQRTMGTLIGGGWLMAQPLFLLAVYTFVFGTVLRVRFNPDDDSLTFALFLMAGLLPFNGLQESLLRAATSLVNSRELIQKVVLPPALLPLVVVFSTLVTEGIGLLILALAVALIMGEVHLTLLALPLLVAVRISLTLGVAWLVSILTIFIRDLAQALGILLTMLLFSTPILYPASVVPERLSWVFTLNPFYYLVENYRNILIRGEWPELSLLWLALGGAGASWLGWLFFQRAINRARDFL
jgi:ABC-type polysaccharide/polyol phosphate export permease